jgi:hypothetical protein
MGGSPGGPAPSNGYVLDRITLLRLTVIDGTWAMEGDGPTEGHLAEMGLILAGTDISGIWGVEEIRDSPQH